MKKLMSELCDLKYSDMITPHNLLENVYLDNYNYVKYFTKDNLMCVELEVVGFNHNLELYLYEFDNEESLQRISMFYKTIRTEIFNRQKMLEKKTSEFVDGYNNIEELRA